MFLGAFQVLLGAFQVLRVNHVTWMNELAEKSTVSRAVQWESSSGRLEIRLWDTFSSVQGQVFRKVPIDWENQVPIKSPFETFE